MAKSDSKEVADVPRKLAVPHVPAAHYKKNLIQQVVCEFRFPTLFELEAAQPPLAFAKALRKEYPTHARQQHLQVSGDAVDRVHGHVFRSKNARWTVTLKSSSVTIETSQYDSFNEFHERTKSLLGVAAGVIDTEFFTRIGLRYINVIPFIADEIGDWVNPALVAGLAAGIYGDVTEHSGRIAGFVGDGKFLLQHGLGDNPATNSRAYVLDFDFSQEDVEVAQAPQVVRELHDREFEFFKWCLGPKAIEHLGESDLK